MEILSNTLRILNYIDAEFKNLLNDANYNVQFGRIDPSFMCEYDFRDAVGAALNFTTNHSVMYNKIVSIKQQSETVLNRYKKIFWNKYYYILDLPQYFIKQATYYLDNAEPPQQFIQSEQALVPCGLNNGQLPQPTAAVQQTANDEPKIKAKPKPTFASIIQHSNREQVLERLHGLIDGRRGADVGAVLLKARLDGYLTRNPTRAEFRSEFNLIGTWQAIVNYMSDNNENALDRANKILIGIK